SGLSALAPQVEVLPAGEARVTGVATEIQDVLAPDESHGIDVVTVAQSLRIPWEAAEKPAWLTGVVHGDHRVGECGVPIRIQCRRQLFQRRWVDAVVGV